MRKILHIMCSAFANYEQLCAVFMCDNYALVDLSVSQVLLLQFIVTHSKQFSVKFSSICKFISTFLPQPYRGLRQQNVSKQTGNILSSFSCVQNAPKTYEKSLKVVQK